VIHIQGLTDAELSAFEGALKTIKALGATVVDNANLPSAMDIVFSSNETIVLDVDFKVGLIT
jgi:amidase